MVKMKTLLYVFLQFVFFSSVIFSQIVDSIDYSDSINIVVLGSSTAFGVGPTSKDSTWVNRYKRYAKKTNPKISIHNLAVGGYTTYHILPNGFIPPANRPIPIMEHNITKALEFKPTAIIINLPSNDAARGYSIDEQISNYRIIIEKANAEYVPLWVATTQPCNYDSLTRATLMEMRDSTYSIWGEYAIDFWNGIADSIGRINPKFDSGDGVHLNNVGHRILFNRVVDKLDLK
jgi:lysophospholipase L1-like esterase